MTVPNICTPAAPIIAVRCWRPRKRDILLQLVEAYAQAKRERNMAEFSDFTIAAYQLIEHFPPSESVRAAGTATCCSTNIRTPPPRRPLCWQHCSTWMRHRGPPSTRWVIRSSRFTHGVVPALVHFRMFQQDFHLSAGYKPFPLSVTRRNSRIVLEAANNLT